MQFQQRNTMDPYLKQKVLSASPQQLIVYLYDLGIASCNNKNKVKLIRVITHLKESLSFEDKTEKISLTFQSVYDHLLFLVRNDKFEDAKNIFFEIKKTWKQANKLI